MTWQLTVGWKGKVSALSNVMGLQICTYPEPIPTTSKCKSMCAKRHDLLILYFGQKTIFSEILLHGKTVWGQTVNEACSFVSKCILPVLVGKYKISGTMMGCLLLHSKW